MKITAWRIFKPRHKKTAFTGEGARLYGGRWNNPGISVVYTSASISLAALELLVHLQSQQILKSYSLCSVTFEEKLVESIENSDLPTNWHTDSLRTLLRSIGDKWANEQTSAVLRVPSAVIETEFNYVLNPVHSDFKKIQIGRSRKFQYDPRFLK